MDLAYKNIFKLKFLFQDLNNQCQLISINVSMLIMNEQSIA